MTVLYPIRYSDSTDLEGDDDDIITLLNPPEQRMLQSLLNNVQENPDLFFEDYETLDKDDLDKFCSDLMLKLMGVPLIVPVARVDIVLENYETSTGVWVYGSTPTEYRAGIWGLAAALNNSVEWHYIALRKGQYVIRMAGRKGNSYGIAHFKLDGLTYQTYDFYNATSLTNQRMTTAAFDIPDDGVYVFKIQMASKNASSSNYLMQLSLLEFIRIADI